MALIIGLGNYGREYQQTRHNIGFLAVESFAQKLKTDFKLWGPAKNSDLAQCNFGSEKLYLLKPLTYMNNSGHSAVQVAHFFKILPEAICVIHDDLDLAAGTVRLKIGGGDGGHNGLKSLTQHLATPNYARIRMGIGRPTNPNIDTADYVLSDFSSSELNLAEDMIERSHQAIEAFIKGIDSFKLLMNRLNQKPKQDN